MTMAVYEGPLLGLDTETTGVETNDPMTRVVTCSMVYSPHPDAPNVAKEWMMNPEIEIPTGASDVHGITTAQAQAEGMNYREGLTIAANTLANTIKSQIPLTAFNAAFDFSLLRNEFLRHEISFDYSLWEHAFIIDPFVLDKAFDKYRKGKRTLGIVSGIYGYDLTNAHNATADVEATIHVTRRMIPQLMVDNALPSKKELMDYQKAQYRTQNTGLEAHFRRTKNDDTIVINKQWPFKIGGDDE